MIGTIRTLVLGMNARAEEAVRDAYSVELIDQKIRESNENLKAAKMTLASLIQRQRKEESQIALLEDRASDFMEKAKSALADGRGDLAGDAAQAVADMENELTVRRDTSHRLDRQIMRLRSSVESAHRRIVDLKQGAIAAKAVTREHRIQGQLNKSLSADSPMDEAAALIERALGQDDPLEQSQILQEIDQRLNHDDIGQRLEDAGFGKPNKTRASDILNRLKDQPKT